MEAFEDTGAGDPAAAESRFAPALWLLREVRGAARATDTSRT
jgi:hypothetical protein